MLRLSASPKLEHLLTVTPLPKPLVHPSRGNLPVLLSVPHSGRDYPDWLVAMASRGPESLVALEDPLVDRLVWRTLQRGVGAVIARTPRAAVDCNRAEDEVDPAIVEGARRASVTARARGGLGIIPSRTQQHGFLWRRTVSPSQLNQRLDQAHRPYHAAVEEQLELLLDRFGCALLLDCHSMPPPPEGVPPIIFGDCRGRSADAWVALQAMEIARRSGFGAGLNDPFAGGHIIERHGAPARAIHAIQVEIDRRYYLDDAMANPGPGFDKAGKLIEDLAVELGEALLGSRFATAAE